jgi:uncharacterized protein YjiS (DUF1127 family)
MSDYLQVESATSFAKPWSLPWRAFFNGGVGIVRTCLERGRQRQELFDYMAVDYRAAADIGIADNDARDWARRPLWRP